MNFTLTKETVLEAFGTEQSMAKASAEIGRDLIDNKYDITSFVESLGFALTATEAELRVNGTKLLSLTLGNLPVDYLTAAQLDFIVAFYCDRVKDQHNVIPAIIIGISSLAKMTHLSPGSVTKIIVSFFQHVSCQSQSRGDRENIYKFLKHISENYQEELTAMGANFIYNIINSMDAERDPRNLVFLFDMMPTFIKKYPLHHLAEEMFETFACYFPVDFQPVKDDTNAVSRDQLAAKLSNCLVVHNEFAEWVIPLALEKLDSDLIVAKLDSLALLSRCAEAFDSSRIEQSFDEIWSHLKKEILPGSGNNAIVQAAVNTLNAILANASQQPAIAKGIQTKVLGNVLPYISNPSHRLFVQSFRIAETCVSNSPVFAGEKILNAMALQLKENQVPTDQKIKLFTTANRILAICATRNAFAEMDPTMLEQIRRELINSVTADSAELLNLAWKNIEQSVGIFSDQQRDELYDKMMSILISEKYQIDLSQVLEKYAAKYPDEIDAKIIGVICSKFDGFTATVKRNVFGNIIGLVRMPRFEEKLMNLLVGNLFNSNTSLDVEVSLESLRKLLETNIDEALIKRIWNNYNVFENFNKLADSGNLTNTILAQIAIVLSLLVRKLSIEDQQATLDKYLPQMKVKTASDLYILQGIIGYVNENVSLRQHFDPIFDNLTRMCLEIDDPEVRHVGHSLLCSLANRVEKIEDRHKTIKKSLHFLRDEIKKGRREAVEVLAWIGKGLIVSGHEESGEIIEDISKLLDHPTLSVVAELAFDIISAEFPELHLPIVKFLFKQKIFHIVLHKLWDKLIKYEENHVNAFVHVLGMTPHPVLKMYLEKIGPIIFKCIESEKIKTVQISLKVIKGFLDEQNDYFRTHFNHLIPQLMKLTTRQDSMEIRINALECLETISRYPIFMLQPYKMDVVLGLAASLDDRKRLVRSSAVHTRNAWFLLGSAAGEAK